MWPATSHFHLLRRELYSLGIARVTAIAPVQERSLRSRQELVSVLVLGRLRSCLFRLQSSRRQPHALFSHHHHHRTQRRDTTPVNPVDHNLSTSATAHRRHVSRRHYALRHRFRSRHPRSRPCLRVRTVCCSAHRFPRSLSRPLSIIHFAPSRCFSSCCPPRCIHHLRSMSIFESSPSAEPACIQLPLATIS